MTLAQRWTTMAALFVIGVASLAFWHAGRAPQRDAATPAPGAAPDLAAARTAAPAAVVATPVTADYAIPAGLAELVGEASGTMRFTLPGARGEPDVGFEWKPVTAVGIWLPGEKRLRVALLQQMPDFITATHAVDALVRDNSAALPGQARVVVELAFMPAAQAYTPDEVESIRLLVTDEAGRSASVDLGNSVQWSGGLAAPEVSTAVTQVRMQSAGNGESSDSTARAQSWNFSTALPVAMRR